MKKPFGINFITFISIFQIIFSAMTLAILMFLLSMNVEVASEAFAFKEMISMSLFNRPVEALTSVHYSIIVMGTLLPTILLVLVLRMIKSKNLKFTRTLFIVKFILDLLRLNPLNIIIDLMMILVIFKDKKTLNYFSEKDIKNI